jgi:hypothetical protein
MLDLFFISLAIFIAFKAFKLIAKQQARNKRPAEPMKVQKPSVVPKSFDLEYHLENYTLCVAKNEEEGGFDLFSRLGRKGAPRKEGNFPAENAGEALAKALKELELKVI